MLSDQLISINDLIKRARQAGVTFGFGDPRVHLAYLTKLRLLPQAVRRKVNGKITGCYPEAVLPLLQSIEELKNKGLTYAQIRYKLQNSESEASYLAPAAVPLPSFQAARAYYPQAGQTAPTTIAFLIVGLILGYILASLNGLNNSKTNQSLAAASLPSETQNVAVSARVQNPNQPIYLIALPNENLYKLGQMPLSDLIK